MRTKYLVSVLVVFAWSLSLWCPGAPMFASPRHPDGDVGAFVRAMTFILAGAGLIHGGVAITLAAT